MWMKSKLALSLALQVLFALGTEPLALAAPRPDSPQVKQAVDKGVKWLLQQQKPDGSFSENKGGSNARKGDVPNHGGAMTSLVIMGLSSVGHMPGDPTPEGQAVTKALQFMLEFVEPDRDNKETEGYLGRADRSRMYGHGIMTLMYAEMLGMVKDPEMDRKIRERLEGAIKLILRSQKVPKSDGNKGGWRYEPQSSDADISVTVWQLMSLRAAKNAGLDAPNDAIADAVAYVKRSSAQRARCLGPPQGLGRRLQL